MKLYFHSPQYAESRAIYRIVSISVNNFMLCAYISFYGKEKIFFFAFENKGSTDEYF